MPDAMLDNSNTTFAPFRGTFGPDGVPNIFRHIENVDQNCSLHGTLDGSITPPRVFYRLVDN
jgi:hypothetical protein